MSSNTTSTDAAAKEAADTVAANANATPTFKQSIAKLAIDELGLFLPVLDDLFTSLQQKGVNVQAVLSTAMQEKLKIIAALPQAESTAIADTAAAAQAQLHALISKATAPLVTTVAVAAAADGEKGAAEVADAAKAKSE